MRSSLSLPAPIFTPTTPSRRPDRRGKRGGLPLIVEAEAVDDGAVGGGAENAWGGIALLRLRRQRSDLDEAEPRGEQRRKHPRILVEASRHADRIAEVEAPQRLREPRIVRRRGAGIKPKLKALDGKIVRPLRIERVQQRLAKAVQRVHGATPSGRRCVPSSCSTSASTEMHMVEVERPVEMREQLAAARCLPAKPLSKPLGVDGKKHEIALAGEIFGQGAGDLVPCRQMDKAVAGIVGRAIEAPTPPRLLELALEQIL